MIVINYTLSEKFLQAMNRDARIAYRDKNMITPQTLEPKLAKAIGLNADLFFKREDLHPYGSHKGRSIPLMIEKCIKDGHRDFVISSSGNAALAAVIAIKEFRSAHLTVYVGKGIDEEKLKELRLKIKDCDNVELKQVSNPKQSAFKVENEGKAKFLRQSTDDNALLGYHELAKELSEIKNLSAVFVPTSSGTTAQGLFDGFNELEINPQIHIIQTEACHPFVVETRFIASLPKTSIASAIVDMVAHRKNKVLNVIRTSRGQGWVVSDDEIKAAIKMARKTEGIDISPNSALSLAGLKKAVDNGYEFKGSVVCLITGK